jgi:hypothetical protein
MNTASNYPNRIQTNDPSLEGVENYPRIKGSEKVMH